MSRLTPLVLALCAMGCSGSGLVAQEARIAEPGTVPPVEDPGSTSIDDDPAPDPAEADPPETDPPEADPPENDPPETEDEPPPGEPPPPIPPPNPPPPPSNPNEVCYPGPNLTWDVCVPLVDGSGLGPDYSYPSPLNGSAQYRAPEKFLDLAAVPADTMIAPNFRLDEIAQEYKGQYGVVQPHAIDRLQDVRDDLGPIVVNSGYRPPAYNASVGGATHSRHMFGDAFDMSASNASLATLQSTCNTHGAGYVGVYATHIHCDWRSDTVSVEFFGAPTGTFTYHPPQFDAVILPDAVGFEAPAEGWDEGEPLREWTAYDADGWAIETAVGDRYEPPAGTASVEVWIGREIVRTFDF